MSTKRILLLALLIQLRHRKRGIRPQVALKKIVAAFNDDDDRGINLKCSATTCGGYDSVAVPVANLNFYKVTARW